MECVVQRHRYVCSSRIFLGDETERAGAPAHHYQKMRSSVLLSLSFSIIYLVLSLTLVFLQELIQFTEMKDPFVSSMLWAVFWNFSHKMGQWLSLVAFRRGQEREGYRKWEGGKEKKKAGRVHIFSCKEIFIGFIYPMNLCCGFMPLKTIFPIKIEVFLSKNCKCHFSIFSLAWGADR